MPGRHGTLQVESRAIDSAGEIAAGPYAVQSAGCAVGRQEMNGMTCREFDEVVHELVRLKLRHIPAREEALDHAANCAACADRMDQARTLTKETEAAANSAR